MTSVSLLAAALLSVLLTPTTPARAQPAIPPGLERAYELLVAYDQQTGAGLLQALETAGVQVAWARGRGTNGQPSAFLARGGAVVTGGTIFLDEQLLGASPEALAALLAHEARHAADLMTQSRPADAMACAESEIRAHIEQAQVWAYLVGAGGKPDATPGLESDLNELLLAVQSGPDAIHAWIAARGLQRC